MANIFTRLKARRDAMNQGDPTGYAGEEGFDNGPNHEEVSNALKEANGQVERNYANGAKAEREKEKAYNQRNKTTRKTKPKSKSR